jgi:hypothetical protein
VEQWGRAHHGLWPLREGGVPAARVIREQCSAPPCWERQMRGVRRRGIRFWQQVCLLAAAFHSARQFQSAQRYRDATEHSAPVARLTAFRTAYWWYAVGPKVEWRARKYGDGDDDSDGYFANSGHPRAYVFIGFRDGFPNSFDLVSAWTMSHMPSLRTVSRGRGFHCASHGSASVYALPPVVARRAAAEDHD